MPTNNQDPNKLADKEVLQSFMVLRAQLQRVRPPERSERSRRYAITITEFEKAMAYFQAFVVESDV